MTIPSKEDFDEITKLYSSMPEGVVKDEDLDSVVPDKTLLTELFSRYYDVYAEYLGRLEQLKAYKWLTSSYQWKSFLKAEFKVDNSTRSSKEEYVRSSVKWLLKLNDPITTVDYYLYVLRHMESRKSSLPKYLEHYGRMGYKPEEIKYRYDKTFPIKSFDEINNPEKRRMEFDDRKELLSRGLKAPWERPLELHILIELGAYFYDESYLDSATGKPKPIKDEEEIDYYSNRLSVFEKALGGVESVILAVHSQLKLEIEMHQQDLDYINHNNNFHINETDELSWRQQNIKKQIDFLIQLEEFKDEAANSCHETVDRLNGTGEWIEEHVVIKRVDKTAKERLFSYKLWCLLRKPYSCACIARPVKAIEWLLQIEGIKNIPDRRTIERWLQAWDEERKENERQLFDNFSRLEF